jgi:hypothetical protein
MWRARATSPTCATLPAGAFMCAIVPLLVPGTDGPSKASGANARITSIEAFLRLTGRASGASMPSLRRISVNSSDSRRQPRQTRAAHSVLLPEPGGAGRMIAQPLRSMTAACTIR